MKSSYVRSMDVMGKGGKMFLALPFLDLSWGLYRITKSASQDKLGQMMLGAVLFTVGIPFMWLVDFISIAKTGTIPWFKDKYEEGVPLQYFKNQYGDLYGTSKAGKAEEEDVETII